jgi:hypothetical protein
VPGAAGAEHRPGHLRRGAGGQGPHSAAVGDVGGDAHVVLEDGGRARARLAVEDRVPDAVHQAVVAVEQQAAQQRAGELAVAVEDRRDGGEHHPRLQALGLGRQGHRRRLELHRRAPRQLRAVQLQHLERHDGGGGLRRLGGERPLRDRVGEQVAEAAGVVHAQDDPALGVERGEHVQALGAADGLQVRQVRAGVRAGQDGQGQRARGVDAQGVEDALEVVGVDLLGRLQVGVDARLRLGAHLVADGPGRHQRRHHRGDEDGGGEGGEQPRPQGRARDAGGSGGGGHGGWLGGADSRRPRGRARGGRARRLPRGEPARRVRVLPRPPRGRAALRTWARAGGRPRR